MILAVASSSRRGTVCVKEGSRLVKRGREGSSLVIRVKQGQSKSSGNKLSQVWSSKVGLDHWRSDTVVRSD